MSCCFHLYNIVFPLSCYLVIVVLLCFSLVALPSSCSLPVSCHSSSVMLPCFCNVGLPLPCYFATFISISLCLCDPALPLLYCFDLLCLCQDATCSAITKIYPCSAGHPHVVYGCFVRWHRCSVGALLLPHTVYC